MLICKTTPVTCQNFLKHCAGTIACVARVWRRGGREIILYGSSRLVSPTVSAINSVTKIPVTNNPRFAGQSHYGVWNRLFKSFADLLAVRWMKKRMIRYEIVEKLN